MSSLCHIAIETPIAPLSHRPGHETVSRSNSQVLSMKCHRPHHQPCRSPLPFVVVYVPFLLIVICRLTVAEIAVISQSNETVAVFFDVELGLGGPLPSDGMLAKVLLAEPDDSCTPIQKAPAPVINSTIKWFVLTKRFPCSFVTKMRSAIAAGFDGIIVYNIEPNFKKNISFSRFPSINAFDGIPAVLISKDDGLALRNNYLHEHGYYIIITPDFSQNLLSYLLPFAVVIGICLIIMISFMVVKCVRDRRKSRRHRLSSKHLKKIPTTKFKKGDHYDTCAICLDEYVDGEKLRVLPCGHVYHMKCIDPWLTKNRRVCPVCKGKVVLPGIADPTDSESEAENAVSERTPLVSNARPTRWRRPGRAQRPPAVAIVSTSAPLSQSADRTAESADERIPSASTEVSVPVTSGHMSVNWDSSDGTGLDVREASTSSTVAVIEVEPLINETASVTGTSAPHSARRPSRRTRRSHAIV